MNEILRPSAAGDETALTPIPGTGEANWQDVDDVTPDDDSTVVSTANYTVFVRDLYTLANHTQTGTIVRVEVHIRFWQKSKIAIKPTTVWESNEFSYSANQYYDECWHWNKNPDTGLPWTWGDIDNLQAGVALKATGSAKSIQNSKCTQLYVKACTVLIAPEMTTQAADEITANSAKLHGTLKWTGGEDADQAGFEVWRFPTSIVDPQSGWSNEEHLLLWDNYIVRSNTAAPNYGQWLEIYLDTARAVKGFGYRSGQDASELNKIYVEFYYSGQWNFAFEDVDITTLINGQWHSHTDLTEHVITGARIKIAASGGYGSGCIMETVFLCSGDQWENSATYGQGAIFDHTITGLNPLKQYCVRAKAHNSAGWGVDGVVDWVIFTTVAAPAVGRSYGYIIG